MPGAAPWTLRVARLARLALHLARGLAITMTRYPRLSPAAQREEVRRWSRQMLSILSVKLDAGNAPAFLPPRCMLVMNHVSWLDVFIINAWTPATFIAKSEVRSWPLIGALCVRTGTLFIERGRRAAVRHANAAITEAITRGELVAVCPEGTTTFGDTLEPFHAALLQPAIAAGAVLQPVALRYADAQGRHSIAAAYVGETSLLGSIWSLVSARELVAGLVFTAPLPTAGRERRGLARDAEAAIAAALGVAAPARTGVTGSPNTPGNPPAPDGDPPDG